MRKCSALNSYLVDVSHKAQSSKFLYFFFLFYLRLLQIYTIITYFIVKTIMKIVVTQLTLIDLSNFQ